MDKPHITYSTHSKRWKCTDLMDDGYGATPFEAYKKWLEKVQSYSDGELLSLGQPYDSTIN